MTDVSGRLLQDRIKAVETLRGPDHIAMRVDMVAIAYRVLRICTCAAPEGV
jgi:hypothetical protein